MNELFSLFSALHSWHTVNSKFNFASSQQKVKLPNRFYNHFLLINNEIKSKSAIFRTVFVIFSGKTGSGLLDFCCFTIRALASFSFLEHLFRYLLVPKVVPSAFALVLFALITSEIFQLTHRYRYQFVGEVMTDM